jgi:hypothetical protein
MNTTNKEDKKLYLYLKNIEENLNKFKKCYYNEENNECYIYLHEFKENFVNLNKNKII